MDNIIKTNNNVDMLLLMGGKSKRMGEPKAYLDFFGSTFYEKITKTLSHCGDIYLSLDKIENTPKNCKYNIVLDEYNNIGVIGAIYSGLKKIKNEYMFVCACDIPYINEQYISTLISFITKDTNGIFVIDYLGRIEPTASIYSKKMLPIIEEMITSGDLKIINIIDKMDIKMVPYEKLGINQFVLQNINTKEEYKKYIVDRNLNKNN
ncbi:MAG: molybdenum cofactor guanylyltransferase [Eubacteriales bacterium]|nr:molybdenum cofactor guanylyltransferase [Eubacteriales bacterium]